MTVTAKVQSASKAVAGSAKHLGCWRMIAEGERPHFEKSDWAMPPSPQ
jgi:hypothetical protein